MHIFIIGMFHFSTSLMGSKSTCTPHLDQIQFRLHVHVSWKTLSRWITLWSFLTALSVLTAVVPLVVPSPRTVSFLTILIMATPILQRIPKDMRNPTLLINAIVYRLLQRQQLHLNFINRLPVNFFSSSSEYASSSSSYLTNDFSSSSFLPILKW